MRLTVVKQFTFDAAHYLPDYDGPCRRVHGHTYKLEVGYNGHIDEHTGMVMDFGELKKRIEEGFVKKLDHSLLNERFINPTAEVVLEWICLILKGRERVDQSVPKLEFIRLWETPTSYVEWRKEWQL